MSGPDSPPTPPPVRSPTAVVYERTADQIPEAALDVSHLRDWFSMVGAGIALVVFAGLALPAASPLIWMVALLLFGLRVFKDIAPSYQATPARIVRTDLGLIAYAAETGEEIADIRFADVRRVLRSEKELWIRYGDGREDRFRWFPAAREAVVSALADAVLLQQLSTEPGTLVPLLHVPAGERDLVGFAPPAGDADCPACGRHMPSAHWFTLDSRRKQVVCLDCARGPLPPASTLI